jgi:tRNA threonylcarbamoyl adenosine modification protein YeaZ
MRVLAIDTSSAVASAAVAEENRLLGEITFNYKMQHSTILMPMIDRLLSSLEMDVRGVDAIACASGPGSFTGLRIGAATAKGLCQGSRKPLIGVPTLDGLAFNTAYSRGIICPIMDALKDNVYTSLYRWEGDGLFRLEDYMAIPIGELIEKLKPYNESVIFMGDGVFVQRERLSKELGPYAVFAPVNNNMQRASSIAAIALKRLRDGDIDNYMEFAPFYLRKSQAEREYDRKNGGSL